MNGGARKRSVWGAVLPYVLMAVPVAGGAYFVYEKQQTLAEAAAAPAKAAAPAEEPPHDAVEFGPNGKVMVAPTVADPEQLRLKQEQDGLLRKQAARQRTLRSWADTEPNAPAGPAGSGMKSTGATRASTVGPAPEPPAALFPSSSAAQPPA